jgi:2-polyprenyl-3-methyl-5-hydroxy-6-metoxy-1,4-benzoquinol methylase
MKPLEDYSREVSHDRWEFYKLVDCVRKNEDGIKLNILEFGCGDGRCLHALSRLGHSCYGIDVNPNAIKKARTLGLANLTCASLNGEYADKFRGFFHLIFSFHTLEHLDNPGQIIDYLSHMCRENGLLYLSVPNPERLSAKLFEETWDAPPYHLTKWSQKCLRCLWESKGFEPTVFFEEPLTFKSAYIYTVDVLTVLIGKTKALIRFAKSADSSKKVTGRGMGLNCSIPNKGSLIKKLVFKSFALLATYCGLLVFIFLKLGFLVHLFPSHLNKGLSLAVLARKKQG